MFGGELSGGELSRRALPIVNCMGMVVKCSVVNCLVVNCLEVPCP